MIIDILDPVKSTSMLNCSYDEDQDTFQHFDAGSFVKAVEEASQKFHVVGAITLEGLLFAAFDKCGNEIAFHFITIDSILNS